MAAPQSNDGAASLPPVPLSLKKSDSRLLPFRSVVSIKIDARQLRLAHAARDRFADCLVTPPRLLSRDAGPTLHFWFANLDGMRQEIAPALTAAYAAWRDGDGGRAIGDAVRTARARWQSVCEDVLALDVDRGVEAQTAIAALSASAVVRL